MALKHWVPFFEELEFVRGRSKNTVLAYSRDLSLFDAFLKTKKPMHEIYYYLTSKKLSERSQARVISSIRTYYKYCEQQGESIPDLTQLKPPRVSAKLPKALSMEDFHKLYDAAVVEDLPKTARNHMVLLMLFGTGCRVSELIQLDLKDFYQIEKSLKILGKGGKERLVPLTAHLVSELNTYIKNARPQLSPRKPEPIFINDRGNRPSRIDIWRWLDQWSSLAGFVSTISPHQFRHGCATSLLEEGADLRSIQKLLGHSSIQTTHIYTSVSTKLASETVQKHHPLSSLKK